MDDGLKRVLRRLRDLILPEGSEIQVSAFNILAISALVFTGMAGCGKGSGADQAYGARYLEKIGELEEIKEELGR